MRSRPRWAIGASCGGRSSAWDGKITNATGLPHHSSARRLSSYYGANVLLHRDRLDARLELIAVIRAAKEQRNPEHPTSGFGRLDAFDGTRNFIFTRLRKADAGGDFEVNRANMVTLDAAVKFPPLWSRKAQPPEPVEAYSEQPQRFPAVWGFKDYDWVEWTINTNTVMERNFTETLGAGATVVLDPKRNASLFDSSIPIKNLHELEWLAYYIDPPRWPTAVFGAIKPDLVASGERIFQSRCAGCHEYGDDRRTPTGLIRLRGMRPEAVGTDPTAALRISCPVPDHRCARDPIQVLHRRRRGAPEGLRRRQGRHALRR